MEGHSALSQNDILFKFLEQLFFKVGVMTFLGYFIMYVVRYDLSVHVLDMTQIFRRDIFLSTVPKNDSGVFTRGWPALRSSDIIGLLNTDVWKIAILFSGYHIGYVICLPIFHNWSDRLGPTLVVGISGIISGALNCLSPAAALTDLWVLFIVRILIGFCAGAMQPSMVQLIRHWVPPIERNHFMWAHCGITTGTFSTFFLCALIQYFASWAVGFYLIGIVQIVWAITWFLCVTDCPAMHPFISRGELEYLNNTITGIFAIKLTNSQAPWGKILRSIPFWALCNLNFGYAWMIIAVCMHGPLYYATVVNYNIYMAAILTGLPFLLRFILGTIVIQTFHWYKKTADQNRVRTLRKYCIVVSHVLPGIIVSSFWLTYLVPGPIIITLATTLTAAGMDLTLDLSYELSPTFANTLNTVIKMIGNIPGILISFGVAVATQSYPHNYLVWKHIWCFHALVLLASGLIYLIWGESNVQPWNAVRRFRPAPNVRIMPKHSIMSNIMEIDEDESSGSNKQPRSSSAGSVYNKFKPMKLFQSRASTS